MPADTQLLSCRSSLRSVGPVGRLIRLERHHSESPPDATSMVALIAPQPVRHLEHRTVDSSAIIVGQINDARLHEEPAEFDQMPGALAPLDLPAAHVMPRQCRLTAIVSRPVASERGQRRAQNSMQVVATCREKTSLHASPMPRA